MPLQSPLFCVEWEVLCADLIDYDFGFSLKWIPASLRSEGFAYRCRVAVSVNDYLTAGHWGRLMGLKRDTKFLLLKTHNLGES